MKAAIYKALTLMLVMMMGFTLSGCGGGDDIVDRPDNNETIKVQSVEVIPTDRLSSRQDGYQSRGLSKDDLAIVG